MSCAGLPLKMFRSGAALFFLGQENTKSDLERKTRFAKSEGRILHKCWEIALY